MSALIIRSSRRAFQRLIFGVDNISSRFRSILPKKPLDGIDHIFIASSAFCASSAVVLYYNELWSDPHLRDFPKKELHKDEETAQLIETEANENEQVQEEAVETVTVESNPRLEQLEKLEQETSKFKQLADGIVSKLSEEIRLLKDELRSTGGNAEEKNILVDKMESLKRQIEAFGNNRNDLWQSYLLRKLSMVTGVYAFEYAMLNGEPLQRVVHVLQGGDNLIDSALSALPEEAIKEGSKTQLQLQSSFYETKAKLRELALIPEGDGTLSHVVAEGEGEGEANLKVEVSSENSKEENGPESVFGRVERLMKEGNFMDAADVLEHGVEGTEAQSLATEWVKQARLRASVEQVHNVLRAHAAAISISLA